MTTGTTTTAPPATEASPRGGVFVGVGSNLGDRAAIIRAAIAELRTDPKLRVIAESTLHETEPVGGPAGQGRFLNAALELDTSLSARELLSRLQAIERRHGRQRELRWGPRTLDLDLLLFGDERIDEPDLIVPHPRMWERSFVLDPLREICGAARFDALAARWLNGEVTRVR